MFTIVVTDRTAQSRTRLYELVHNYYKSYKNSSLLLPSLNVRPVPINELKFIERADIIIVGEEISKSDVDEFSRIRRSFPDSFIISEVSKEKDTLETLEEYIKLGADDLISEHHNSSEFIKKILLLSKKQKTKQGGLLILVESGKGGLGVTSFTAALGDSLATQNKKVVLIDLDFDSQDLTRSLRVRPIINEHFQLILNNNRPVCEDSVAQCCFKVWEDDSSLMIIPPPTESEHLYDSRGSSFRSLFNFLQHVDQKFDITIVDVGSARGSLLRTLEKVADKILLVINNDPSALHAGIEKARKIYENLSPRSSLSVFINNQFLSGLPYHFIKNEFLSSSSLPESVWTNTELPNCVKAGSWAGSGSTMKTVGGRNFRISLTKLISQLNISDSTVINATNILTDKNDVKLLVSPGRFKISQYFSFKKKQESFLQLPLLGEIIK